MRIGVFCTNEYTTPPPRGIIYAPLEVTQQVADGLSKRGHSVTMYAPKGSRAHSTIVTDNLPPLYKNPKMASFIQLNLERAVATYEQLAISHLLKDAQAGKYDIVHIHPSIRGIFYAPLVTIPVVFTLHDPIIEGKKFFYERIVSPNIHYVSISNAQRKPSMGLPWAGTVYNGIDLQHYPQKTRRGNYFVTYGRLRQEKGIYEAIMAAKKARVALKIAGNPAYGPYWERKIKPHLSRTITYVGTLPRKDIPGFVAGARGLLFPIKWEEPFGLVMIEALACGTPVIAFKRGSVSEVMQHKKTGFVVQTVREMVQAITKIDTIDRTYCRAHVEKHFSIDQMIEGYERIFTRLTQSHGKKNK